MILGDYRGKRLDTGDWVYGSLIKAIPEGGEGLACYIHLDDGDGCDGTHSDGKGYLCANSGMYQVDPMTVGMFTGRYDYSKNKLYQWDIIENSRGLQMVVWYEKRAAFCRISGEGVAYKIPFSPEGIGNVKDNIFDNSKLLSQKMLVLLHEKPWEASVDCAVWGK